MNILFVSHSLLMGGGANRSMVQLILELREKHGVKPVVLIPFGRISHGDQGLANVCKQLNIPIERSIVPWFLHSNVWLHRFKYLIMFLYYPILLQKLKKYHLDVIHSNGSVFDLGARLAKSLCIPHVWHLREFGTENESFKPVLGCDYIRKAYEKADIFIAISDAVKKSYSNRLPNEKITRIYNGISLKQYVKKANHNNENVQFVMVGGVTPHKGQFTAIKAAAMLVKQNVCNFHINIIGPINKEYFATIKSFVDSENLNEFITFWGIRNDVPELLPKMDIGLMLSKSEAFGRVTVEYMLQNLAVIASNTGANPEIIQDGYTGLIVPLNDEKIIASKMRLLIEDKTFMISLANRGCEHALSEFPSKKNTKAIYDIYQQLL